MTWFYARWAWILIAVPIVGVGLYIAGRSGHRRLAGFISPELWQKVCIQFDAVLEHRRRWLSLMALGLLILAALRPQFGTEYAPISGRSQSILLAIDTSLSMDSQDISPSRLEVAKRDLVGLIELIKGDRVGLLTFSGTSSLQCPLTIDYIATKLFIDDVVTADLPIPGTNLAAPINAAVDVFRTIPGRKTLIIYSDGETFEGNYEAAMIAAKSAGIVIHTVGIGTKTGSKIPILDESGVSTGYKRDRSNNEITSVLNETALKEIASATGGRFIRLTADQAAAPQLGVLLGKAGEADYRAYLTPRRHDRYVTLSIIALFLLLVDWVLVSRSKREELN